MIFCIYYHFKSPQITLDIKNRLVDQITILFSDIEVEAISIAFRNMDFSDLIG